MNLYLCLSRIMFATMDMQKKKETVNYAFYSSIRRRLLQLVPESY